MRNTLNDGHNSDECLLYHSLRNQIKVQSLKWIIKYITNYISYVFYDLCPRISCKRGTTRRKRHLTWILCLLFLSILFQWNQIFAENWGKSLTKVINNYLSKPFESLCYSSANSNDSILGVLFFWVSTLFRLRFRSRVSSI